MPTVRSQLLEGIRYAYPEPFEVLNPPDKLGEMIFSGPTPQPVGGTEPHFGVTDGILHRGSKRTGLTHGQASPGECKIIPRNPSGRAQRTHDAPRIGAQRNPPYDFWTESFSPLFRVELSFAHANRPSSARGVFDHIAGFPQLGTNVLRGIGSSTSIAEEIFNVLAQASVLPV